MKMDLSEIVWSDGVILGYRRDRRGVQLRFRDYQRREWELEFTGEDMELYEHDALGFSGFRATLEPRGNGGKLVLRDDEGVILSIPFDQGSAVAVGETKGIAPGFDGQE
jgi:hypothetical protein